MKKKQDTLDAFLLTHDEYCVKKKTKKKKKKKTRFDFLN